MSGRAPRLARMYSTVLHNAVDDKPSSPIVVPSSVAASAALMSRRCRPSSLEALATDVIVARVLPALERVVLAQADGSCVDDALPEGHNPFATCKPAIIESLIEKLQKKRGHLNLTSLQFEILLCRAGVKKLDLFLTSEFLARKDALRFPRMFRRISTFGAELTDLSLEFYLTCNNDELCAMLATLPNLRHFLVAFENLSDRALETLGDKCPQLQKLTLCETPQVTDAGLRSLVDETGTRGCRHLVYISIEGAPVGVTVRSVVYLLEKLPHLEAIHLPSLDKALVVLNEIKPPDFKLALREYKDVNVFSVQTSVRPTMREFLAKSIELCPRLQAIDIEVKTSDDISPLRLLVGLTELSIRTAESTSEWFFYTQLEPVLQEAGLRLTSLKLVMPDVDLAAVDAACPSIKTLQLIAINMCWKRNGVKVRDQPFGELEALFLDPESPHSMKPRDLGLLFNESYALKELVLGCCDSFDDVFVMEALQRGLFRHLTRLELHNQRKVGILGIQQLVLLDEVLESLTLKDCTALSADDLAFLTGSACALNFQLKVQT
ncbi:uncharacterized protein LOC142564675 [Dermacentor variabilis]|uniref:uncharacterized protein LOC142564675 n=1 Tax=Dermacentor variabilis TaxID=34621 RepID=UPI003F5BC8BB